MGEMRDSDWSRENLLRSDWLRLIGATITTTVRANVMANLTSLNKLPNTRVFIAAENGSVEVLELAWLYFSSRRELSVLKTGRGFP